MVVSLYTFTGRPYGLENIWCKTNVSTYETLLSLGRNIGEIVDVVREDLGFSDVKPIDLSPEDAGKLRERIHENSPWRKLARQAIDISSRNSFSLDDDVVNNIKLPWWNQTTLDLVGYLESSGPLDVNFRTAHSYSTQLTRVKDLNYSGVDSASVSCSLVTADGKRLFGIRAGHVGRGSLMTVPAGSVQLPRDFRPVNAGCTNVLKSTVYDELREEIKLEPTDLNYACLIGRVFDHEVGRNSLFVFDLSTRLDSREVSERWSSSEDRTEHAELVFVDNEAEAFLDYIVRRSDREIVPHLLSPGLGTAVLVGRAQFSNDWYGIALERLGEKVRSER